MRREGEEAVAGVVRAGLTRGGVGWWVRNFDVYRVPAHDAANLASIFFIHPRFEIAPPKGTARGG